MAEQQAIERVRITREDVERCNAHLDREGARLGCPVCVLRAERALEYVFRENPALFMKAVEEAQKVMLARHVCEARP